jgi:hypothetical protein
VSADPIWLLNALGVLNSPVSYFVPRCLYTTRVVLHSVERPERAHMTQTTPQSMVHVVLYQAPKSNSEMMIRKRIPRRGPIPEAVNLKCDSGCASAELSYRQLPEHDELMVFQFDEYRAECRAELVSRG